VRPRTKGSTGRSGRWAGGGTHNHPKFGIAQFREEKRGERQEVLGGLEKDSHGKGLEENKGAKGKKGRQK